MTTVNAPLVKKHRLVLNRPLALAAGLLAGIAIGASVSQAGVFGTDSGPGVSAALGVASAQAAGLTNEAIQPSAHEPRVSRASFSVPNSTSLVPGSGLTRDAIQPSDRER